MGDDAVTRRNVAFPIQEAGPWRKGKIEEDFGPAIMIDIRCVQVHSNRETISIVVVNDNGFALRDREWHNDVDVWETAELVPLGWLRNIWKS